MTEFTDKLMRNSESSADDWLVGQIYQLLRPSLREAVIKVFNDPRRIPKSDLDMWIDHAEAKIFLQETESRRTVELLTAKEWRDDQHKCLEKFRYLTRIIQLEPLKWREFTKAALGRANKPLRGKRKKTMLQPLRNK